jgi:pimeloyl-ACP methyl ester carboxylesterase
VPAPLSPAEWFPAGVRDITTRMLSLSTGIRVRVAEAGPSDGRPVVMIHGWGGSLYMFRHGLSILPSQGVRAIAVDLRGYGLSDRPRDLGAYSLDAYLADLDALLDALALPHVTLLAQSMGGGLSLHYALRKPERLAGIALINPSNLVSIPWLWLLTLTPRRVAEALGSRLVPRWLVAFILRHLAFSRAGAVSERDVDQYWAPTQLPRFMDAVRGAIADFDWRPLTLEQSKSLAVPSVVILGMQDRLFKGAHMAAQRLAGAQVVRLPGGHCVHEESPGAVYEIVSNFLEGAGSTK